MFAFSMLHLFTSYAQKSIWHLGDAWLISQYFSLRALKPVAFLVSNIKFLRLQDQLLATVTIVTILKIIHLLQGSVLIWVVYIRYKFTFQLWFLYQSYFSVSPKPSLSKNIRSALLSTIGNNDYRIQENSGIFLT